MRAFLGWFGSICFAVSAAPQALKCYVDKHAKGVAWGFICLWLSGEVCSLIYAVPLKLWPLVLNYACNLVFCSIILYYKLAPKE